MKLLTKQLKGKFPRLYATEKTPPEEKVVIAKFFTPWTNWTWYAVEKDSDDTFFGLELEWGYFTLSELESIKGPFGLTIERDLYFGHPKIGEVPALKGRI